MKINQHLFTAYIFIKKKENWIERTETKQKKYKKKKEYEVKASKIYWKKKKLKIIFNTIVKISYV